MKFWMPAQVLIFTFLFPSLLVAKDNSKNSIVGVWLTQEASGKIQIYKCGNSYCGKTIWISKKVHPNPAQKLDVNNPDPNKRGQKVIGQTILKNLDYDPEDKKYKKGSIYDPDSGKTYRCKAWIKDNGNKLFFRGYWGISLFGKTTTWTKIHKGNRSKDLKSPTRRTFR